MEPDEATHTSPPRSPRGEIAASQRPASGLSEDKRPKLQKRQSLRLRPSEILQNAEPPSPLSPLSTTTRSLPGPQPSVRASNSKMSLFHLFSRPKVEKQRGGYTEASVELPSPRDAHSSKTDLVVEVQPDRRPSPRPASIISTKTSATKSSKVKAKATPQPSKPKERKSGPFEPPPLFQAYPQSTKDGKLEVSNISVETLNKSKSKKAAGTVPNGTSDSPSTERGSVDIRRNSALKYIPNGSAASVDLPRKIFVLVTSGYLLQYAETGPADRLPEKVLHLGKDSAAFACDLVPGKHYVLQVSQAVDQDGIIVVNSGSIFSKLGIRSAAAKRMTSNFVLIMPDADELESWMTAIRNEIEALGGKKARTETSRPPTRDANADIDGGPIDLKRTPSQSWRYRVKRDPSMVPSVPSPVPSPRPDQMSVPASPAKAGPDDPETSTIDDIETEASKLDENGPDKTTSTLLPPLHPLFPEHPRENDANESNNTNASSPVEEAAPPVVTPGTDQPADSPFMSAKAFPEGQDTLLDKDILDRLSNTATPSPTNFSRRSPPTSLTINTVPPAIKHSLVAESPIIPSYPVRPLRNPMRLSSVYSEPNLQHAVARQSRHDSKVSSPPPFSPMGRDSLQALEALDVDSSEIPDSLSDLPLSSPRTSSRLSTYAVAIPHHRTNSSIDLNKPRRIGSFSMPLRVNPAGMNDPTPSANPRRHSRMDEPDKHIESAVVHALTSTTDDTSPASVYHTPSSTPSPPFEATQQQPTSNSPLGRRLSLFPSPAQSSPMLPAEPPRRTSSVSSRHSQQGSGSLRRPTSMQVRADHAPFLSSVRNSAVPSTTTVPIRGMKPSRSASNVAALAQQHSSSIEAFKALNFDTSTPSEEDDLAMPLPPDHTKRISNRKSLKARASMPNMDFGIPVVGLGPPAPPPQAPLPPPPAGVSNGVRPASVVHKGSESISSVNGLGISVS